MGDTHYDLSSKERAQIESLTFAPTVAELEAFSSAGVDVHFSESFVTAPTSLLASIDALLVVSAKVTRADLAQLPSCRVIVRYGSGTDNVDVSCAAEQGIIVANVPDFCLSEVADHTFALLLAAARKLRMMDRSTRDGSWQARAKVEVRRIAGKTLGLIGFGRIAQQVARRASAFDLNVVVYDPFLDPGVARDAGVVLTDMNDLLKRSDFISLHAPLSPKTHHMVGEEQLRSMKRGAILINTGRGGLVDELALVRALSEGWIAGAGIDVYETLPMFDPEPRYVHHPLFDLDNVILTPHTAGTSVESLDQLMLDGAREAIRVLNGETPCNPVLPTSIPVFSAGTLRDEAHE